MGFTNNRWCTVWSVEPHSNTSTKGRISISKKNRDTGEYEEDFSGFVMFAGSSAAQKALKLRERDRIKLNEVDVKTRFVKETGVKYTNFFVYDFDTEAEADGQSGRVAPSRSSTMRDPQYPLDDIDAGLSDVPNLPF